MKHIYFYILTTLFLFACSKTKPAKIHSFDSGEQNNIREQTTDNDNQDPNDTKNDNDFDDILSNDDSAQISDDSISHSAEKNWPYIELSYKSPIYLTYAADKKHTDFLVDQGYQLEFSTGEEPIAFKTDSAGKLSLFFEQDKKRILFVEQFSKKPVILFSSHDLMKMAYQPYKDIKIEHIFYIQNSQSALHEIYIENSSDTDVSFDIVLEQGVSRCYATSNDGLLYPVINDQQSVVYSHKEFSDPWTKENISTYYEDFVDIIYTSTTTDSITLKAPCRGSDTTAVHGVQIRKSITLKKGEHLSFRLVHFVQIDNAVELSLSQQQIDDMLAQAKKNIQVDVQSAFLESENYYQSIPKISFEKDDDKTLYYSAFQMLHQCFVPKTGKIQHDFYIFSREPAFNFGHEGQVFHESLSMLAYVYMNPIGAMDSQRVYIDAQETDGFIPYRVGPYSKNPVFSVNGDKTTSAPWYSYQNYEIYLVSKDKQFLSQAFESGVKFLDYLKSTRDKDGDGLYEWGGHAVLESVRDGFVPTWNIDWPSNFEAVDLNSMMVKEAQSLALMAKELGKIDDEKLLNIFADELSNKINIYFWDENSGFYYHADKKDNDFTYNAENDLKIQEISGLLPLWANVATPEQAKKLVVSLFDINKFWRKYGIPSISADHPDYDGKANRCCKWNGPVWIQWNYLIFRGLIDYGYYEKAHELAQKVFEAVRLQLKDNHNFYELYSPDDSEKNSSNKQYIWTGIISRMMIDIQKLKDEKKI